jgi:hypothetical protein
MCGTDAGDYVQRYLAVDFVYLRSSREPDHAVFGRLVRLAYQRKGCIGAHLVAFHKGFVAEVSMKLSIYVTVGPAELLVTDTRHSLTALAVLYRDASAYPEPIRSQLRKELRDYVDYVIHEA